MLPVVPAAIRAAGCVLLLLCCRVVPSSSDGDYTISDAVRPQVYLPTCDTLLVCQRVGFGKLVIWPCPSTGCWGEVLIPLPLLFRSLLLHYTLLFRCRRCLLIPTDTDYTSIFDPHPLLFPPTVSRAGRMSSASSHSESRSVELSTHRSRVLSRLSGDSMSVAVVPSSSALGDSETIGALAAMQSFFNVDSIVTTRRLVEVRKNYFIPLEYELHVPLSGERPYNAFPCGFSLLTDALEARLRFSLHPLIEACLKQWRISPSQMTPNSWRYMVAFL
ncbi:hypothetical protein GW17_00059405 [Ensete ventricosum]|nr:hypothetical protein GW17_00059405 [Ensete ventricosum]